MENYILLYWLEVKKLITLRNKVLNNINLFKFKPESLDINI